jgi:5-methylcytosine-specific restriction protein A
MPRRDQRSAEAQAYRAFYKTAAWRKRRLLQLKAVPLCERCKAQGRIVGATVAHHVEPHKGDWAKFIRGELRSSCAPCHNSIEQSVERLGYEKGSDASGAPINPEHHWNR